MKKIVYRRMDRQTNIGNNTVINDGWIVDGVAILHLCQQYFSHIRTIGG